MIEIIEASSPKERQHFIKLPYLLHNDHPQWVPPLLIDEEKLFSPKTNPLFSHCTTVMLLAYKNGELVGRCMGIIHRPYNQLTNTNIVRFGFIESIDDISVFEAMISYLEKWAIKYDCNKLIGPFGFSDKDPQGFNVEGYDESSVIITNCNKPYMVDFTNSLGFKSFFDLVQYRVPINIELIESLKKYSNRTLESGKIKLVPLKRSNDARSYVRQVFNLMNCNYGHIYGFSPITKNEADEFANRFLPLLNPNFIKIIIDNENKVLGFIIAIQDMAKGLKKSNGKLLPWGWWHIWRSIKTSNRLVLLLGAIDEKKRNQGLDAVLGYHLLKSAHEMGLTELDSHLIMSTNLPMRREIEHLKEAKLYKKYTVFEKDISMQ